MGVLLRPEGATQRLYLTPLRDSHGPQSGALTRERSSPQQFLSPLYRCGFPVSARAAVAGP